MRFLWNPGIVVVLSAGLVAMPVAAQEAKKPPNCEQAASTPEIAFCAELELREANVELSKVFKDVIAKIKAASHINVNQRRDWERAMREAQLHWIAFRDKDCGEVTGWEWYRGTGQGAATLGCKAAKTKARAEELKARYTDR
ncbi:MAG: lysozyme inhibitor LprI family protein [Hyphomicrobiaceae bacterium]